MKPKEKPVRYEGRSRGFVVIGTVAIKPRGGKETVLKERPISGYFFNRGTAEEYVQMVDQSLKPWIKEMKFRKGVFVGGGGIWPEP